MKTMLEAFWMLLKTIIEGFILSAEDTYPPGSGVNKKDAVIKAVRDLLKTIPEQFPQIPSWFITLVSFLTPWIVDAIVSQLSSEGKLKPHQTQAFDVPGKTFAE